MDIKTKRFLLFLIGCIGSRSALAFIAKNYLDYLPYLGYICLAIGLGFVYIFIYGSETADKQLEWTGDKKIWWNDLRIVHGLNYILFGLLAINKKDYAWMIIALDTLIGLISWLKHHKIL
jgi:hypothetical protein